MGFALLAAQIPLLATTTLRLSRMMDHATSAHAAVRAVAPM
jgi:hypothetical protein